MILIITFLEKLSLILKFMVPFLSTLNLENIANDDDLEKVVLIEYEYVHDRIISCKKITLGYATQATRSNASKGVYKV